MNFLYGQYLVVVVVVVARAVLGQSHGRTAWNVQGIEDGRRPPALRTATPETAVRPFRGWSPARRRGVGYGGP
jgi:hypothetical protein